jgi:hypothetical protein
MKNLKGQTFGRLIVIKDTGKRTRFRNVIYLCLCRCGNMIEVPQERLRKGDTKSCGCLKKELNYKHGDARKKNQKRLYGIWNGMRGRCNNLKDKAYKYYGARGIQVCKEWRNSYFAFKSWATLSGYKEGLSIDRIDNDGNYEPSNCQWITRSENAAKQDMNRFINGRFKKKEEE